jgi:hypothetical protein
VQIMSVDRKKNRLGTWNRAAVLGMRERAWLYDGSPHAGTRSGGWSTVRARLPLPAHKRALGREHLATWHNLACWTDVAELGRSSACVY